MRIAFHCVLNVLWPGFQGYIPKPPVLPGGKGLSRFDRSLGWCKGNPTRTPPSLGSPKKNLGCSVTMGEKGNPFWGKTMFSGAAINHKRNKGATELKKKMLDHQKRAMGCASGIPFASLRRPSKDESAKSSNALERAEAAQRSSQKSDLPKSKPPGSKPTTTGYPKPYLQCRL